MVEQETIIVYFFFTAILAAIGAYLLYIGIQRTAYIRDVLAVNRKPTSYLSPTDDYGKIRGTVEPHPDAEPFRAPFSEEDCVYEDWVVSRKNVITLSYILGGQLEDGTQSIPFQLSDGHGTVTVDLPSIDAVLLGEGENPTENVPIRESLQDKVGAKGSLTNETVRQTILPVGDEVTVFGAVEKQESGTDQNRYRVTGFDHEQRDAVVTNQTDRTLLFRQVGAIGRILVGGGIVTGVAATYLGFLLSMGWLTEYGTLLFLAALAVGICWHVLFVLYLEAKTFVANLTES